MEDIKISVVHYEEWRKVLLAFRNANRSEERNELYFDWRYLRRPNNWQKPVIIVAQTLQGEMIGACSLIPHHFSSSNEQYSFGILGDISVAKTWRGKGVAPQMFRFLSGIYAKKQLRANLVLPNEEASRSLSKANWRTISTMERYVKVINIEKIIRRSLSAIWLTKLIAFPINYILKAISCETYARDVKGYKGAVAVQFDERFDILWNDAEKESMIIGLRNRDYLTWRYKSHPLINYQIFTLTHKASLCGYIVFHYFEDSCYIDDLFYLKKNEHPQYLLTCFLKYIRKTNASNITFHINKNDFFALNLARFGFIKRSDNWRIMIHVDNSHDDPSLLMGDKWFLTAGDKDA